MVVVVEVLVVQIFPDELMNILSLSAVEVDHAPQRVCVNDDASENMPNMVLTLDTFHLDMSQLNDDAEANMPTISITLDTSHLDMSPLNDDAKTNMLCILVTLATFHLEMSPLNDDAL